MTSLSGDAAATSPFFGATLKREDVEGGRELLGHGEESNLSFLSPLKLENPSAWIMLLAKCLRQRSKKEHIPP